MLLALGTPQLDPTARAVVVALVTGAGADCVTVAAAGADALWLGPTATPSEVAQVTRRVGVPVGVTVADLEGLEPLVASGAVAVESASPQIVDQVAVSSLVLWCDRAIADDAVAAGVPGPRIVCEGGGPGVHGVTVIGQGPAAWGAVVQAVQAGARVVRTTDPKAVRRVVTVTDRLLAAQRTHRSRAT